MSATAFAVPVGDPGTLKRAAGTFATLGSDHQGQLTKFNGQVQNALANWRGPIAEQYAVVAGDAARRFSAVVKALTAVHGALNTYASALETAQGTIGSLNRQVAAKDGASAQNQEARSLSGQESTVASTLRQAARTCEQALQTQLNPMAKKMIAQLHDSAEQARLLRGWEQVTMDVEKSVKAGQAATAVEGGSFLEGMLKAQNVEIEAKGAHAAASTSSGAAALDALFRTSKVDVILAPVTIAFGIHDLIWPAGDSTVEKTGNRVAGGVGAFGGALALATWAGGLFGVTWEIPGVDIGTGVIAGGMLLAAGLWAAGDAIYTYRHQIWDGLKDAGEWTWDGLKDAGKSIADMPGNVVHGLEHLANPLDW